MKGKTCESGDVGRHHDTNSSQLSQKHDLSIAWKIKRYISDAFNRIPLSFHYKSSSSQFSLSQPLHIKNSTLYRNCEVYKFREVDLGGSVM
jgi:hypothetical protein